MSKQSYSEQIRSGKWQKLRLEVMQRDQFKCTCCDSQDDLQVHHTYYRPDFNIYDYEPESLKTVCGNCHKVLTFELPKLGGLIAWEILSNKRTAI